MVMNKHQIILIILSVVLIGTCIYFGVTTSNLKEQMNILETDYQNLVAEYDTLEIKHNLLQSSYDLLITDLSFLKSSFDTLETTVATLLPISSGEKEKDICENTEFAVEIWLKNNVDNIAETIGELITLDLPIVKNIASELVSEALLHFLQWEIVDTESASDDQTCIVRTRLFVPIKIDLPLLSKEFKVQVDYLLYVRGGNVMDSDIDLQSFEME